MDDIAGSVNSVAEAESVTNNMTTILDAGGFKIKEWFISKEGKTPEVKAEAEVNTSEKVLGMLWDTERDVLYFSRKSNNISISKISKNTKHYRNTGKKKM